MEGRARSSSTATWISLPWIYSSSTVRPPSFRLSSRARRSSCPFRAMKTPMEEPLSTGLTTTGRRVCRASSSRFSSVTVTERQAGVVT